MRTAEAAETQGLMSQAQTPRRYLHVAPATLACGALRPRELLLSLRELRTSRFPLGLMDGLLPFP